MSKRDKAIAAVINLKEMLKECTNGDEIKRIGEKINEYRTYLYMTEDDFDINDLYQWEKYDNDEIKRKIELDYNGKIDEWN